MPSVCRLPVHICVQRLRPSAVEYAGSLCAGGDSSLHLSLSACERAARQTHPLLSVDFHQLPSMDPFPFATPSRSLRSCLHCCSQTLLCLKPAAQAMVSSPCDESALMLLCLPTDQTQGIPPDPHTLRWREMREPSNMLT